MDRWEQFKKLAQEFHVPVPETWITFEVFDKEGKLIQKHRQKGHSWTRNAYNMLFSELAAVNSNDNTFAAGKLSIKDSGGTVRYGAYPIAQYYSFSMQTAGYGYIAAAGIITNGIIVGSGTNAESFEDYVLQTPIANGTGAGQLSYVASEAYTYSYNAETKVLTATHIRYINNNSGGNVDVNEVGLIVRAIVASAHRYWYNSRDHLSSTVTVPNTSQLKVTYTISLTYPS